VITLVVKVDYSCVCTAVRARAGLLSVVFKKILFQSIPTSTTGEVNK